MSKIIPFFILLVLIAALCGCSRSPSVSTSDKLSPEEIFNSNSEAVVLIRVYDEDGNMVSFGSGVNIHPEGKIITNLHVLRSDCFSFDIKFQKHGVYEEVYITGISPILEDYIILKVNGKDLPSVKVSTRIEYETGEKVFTIGNPEGLLNSLSDGLISGNRKYGALEYYQMTASISHGSSGGAVLDEHGHLIGISTAILEEGQNLNFFVPINRINNAEILDTGLTIKQFNSLRKKRAKEYKETADKFLLAKDYEQAITDYELSLKYFDAYADAQKIKNLIEYYNNGGDLATYTASKGITGSSLSFDEKSTVDAATLSSEKEAAIRLVKKSNAFGGASVDSEIKKLLSKKKGDLKVIGWEAELINEQTYLVSYGFDIGFGVKRIYFEVNSIGDIVRAVSGDIDLEEKYGIIEFLDTKDVRNAAWGMDIPEVKNTETWELEDEKFNERRGRVSRLISGDWKITYTGKLHYTSASIIYTFYNTDKSTRLDRAFVFIKIPKNKISNYSYCMGKFREIRYILEKQYGKVDTNLAIYENTGYHCKEYTNIWETDTTTIEHQLSFTESNTTPDYYTHNISYREREPEKKLKIETQENEDLDNSSFAVFTSTYNNVFHNSNCSKLDATSGTVGYTTAREANEAGCLPCNYCKP